MNKRSILTGLIAELESELRRQMAANERASEGATNSETRAETKWDTCGLELSYLARGYAQQCELLAESILHFRNYTPPDFSDRSIDYGALVKVNADGELLFFFLAKYGGGTELQIEENEVTVITAQSPVGMALLNKKKGDKFGFRPGMNWTIESIE
jgi:hypothetical protein